VRAPGGIRKVARRMSTGEYVVLGAWKEDRVHVSVFLHVVIWTSCRGNRAISGFRSNEQRSVCDVRGTIRWMRALEIASNGYDGNLGPCRLDHRYGKDVGMNGRA
jgi:hypothetical protein